MYIKRAAEATAKRISETFPILLVTGPRQVGKSTMLKMMAGNNRRFVTLDDMDARLLAKTDPALFLQRYQAPLIIDEIQYAPELLPYLKIEVDRTRENGMYWLTGSQPFHLMKNVSESLAGRVGIISLLGLSTSEIEGVPSMPFSVDRSSLMSRFEVTKKRSLPEVFKRIFTGSMPRMHTEPAPDWETFYRSYVNTYLQRDVRDLTQVGDELSFYQFMVAVAARTARPVVYDELAAEVGVSSPTAKKWLSILVSSHIVALVQPYHNNLLKRMTKAPLLHFLDTGLAAYLLKWNNPEALENGAMSGSFFESHVFAEIYKSYLNAGKEPPLFYYRDKQQREIDLLLYENGVVHPIEVKKAASPGKTAIKNFNALSPLEAAGDADDAFKGVESLKTSVGEGAVVCMANDLLPLDARNWYVPVWMI